MSLSDIEKKIIGEAEQEVGRMIAEAERTATQRSKAAEATLARERTVLLEGLNKAIKEKVEQRKILLSLGAKQKILQKKRGFLKELQDKIYTEISGDAKYLKGFFKRCLAGFKAQGEIVLEVNAKNEQLIEQILKEIELPAQIIIKKDWTAGRCELIQGRARINCSLLEYLEENFKSRENKLSEELFT